MIVIMRRIVMRRAGFEVVFRRRVEPEDHAQIDVTFGNFNHGQLSHSNIIDHLASTLNAAVAREIRLRHQHDIRAGNLVLEQLRQRRFVIQAVIRCALRLNLGDIRRETPSRYGFSVGERDNSINCCARSDRWPLKRFEQRLWQRQP